jgi:hypothetical protein
VYEPIEAEKKGKKSGGAKAEDIVRVTTAPWAGELGVIESRDGAYHIVRLDSSKHPEDVQELYPNEFEVVTFCTGCGDWHDGERCYS